MVAWVYIMASKPDGALYVGVTNDLARRVFEHRNNILPGFTSSHGCKRLVFYREYPTWSDLYERLHG